jgi:hypothetical protein
MTGMVNKISTGFFLGLSVSSCAFVSGEDDDDVVDGDGKED